MNDSGLSSSPRDLAWAQLRGSLKDIFDELGGGEAYLRAERSSFSAPSATLHLGPEESAD